MIHSEQAEINSIALHAVGNKQNNDPLHLSTELMEVSEPVKNTLKSYFLNPFKTNEFFHFYHESDLSLNEMYQYANAIFEDHSQLFNQSINIARHLYEQCNHPKIKSGELYVVLFNDCCIDGEIFDAIGIFKAENKDTFLKVYQSGDNFVIESDNGVNINKLDKGCLIFNSEKEKGYIVSVVDNTNRNLEAQYWIDDFLKVKQRKDEFYNTQNTLTLCKDFVVKCLPEEFEVSKADQAELLSKSVNFFKKNDTFDMNDFTQEVISEPSIIQRFNDFRTEFEEEREIEVADSFNISESALKKQAKQFKSIIKLDKNFHIYIHGNTKLIKKGVDEETGLNYYQLFFNEES